MNPATLTSSRGRSSYEGFRSVIKAVGTGRRGSRSLTVEEAQAAVGALLAGEVSPAQAGAFLVALRIKGETPEELAGAALALRAAVHAPPAPSADRLVASAGAYDGMAEAPHLSLAAAVLAAAAGARVVVHCADRLGPKHGTTPGEVLAALGGTGRPTPEQSLAMLERSGVALVHAGEAVAGFEALAGLREEIGLRTALHTAEKLVGHLGARRFVVGHTHSSYRERILGALELLGADAAVAVRGIEGSDLVRAARPGAGEPGGPLDLPEIPGMVLRGDADPAVAAALTRAICAGADHGAAEATAVLSAAVRLRAAGCCEDPRDGVRLARETIASGRAGAVLDALVA
jgi:anthranilate phosphoribosyltransferase